MPETFPKIRAADHLANLLKQQGTSHIFGVPGESFLPVLDALHGQDNIQFVTCRHEGGAAMAADAHAKLSGRVGVCMVTRGPGATNASAGMHVAFQDSTPMILFIGQVARGMIEREAFQEIDYRRMFGQMAKWVAQIDNPARLQEYISRAYRTALSGRPGPVVLALPEDMLYDEIITPPAPKRICAPRYQPAPKAMNDLQQKLANAQNPLVIVGGGGWTDTACTALEQFATIQNLPVAASLRSQGLFNNAHPNYVGHYTIGGTAYLTKAFKNADLLVVIGARLGEMTTVGYTLLDAPVPQQSLVHVYPAGEELGRVFEPEIALVADYETFCLQVAKWSRCTFAAMDSHTSTLRQTYTEFNDPKSVPDDPLALYFAHLADILPKDAILTNGAGNYAGWLHRFYRYSSKETQLAPTSGSMGYGLPAAVAAAITSPHREVYAIAGDGCFMMTMQELATAKLYRLRLTVIIINNNRLGTIRAHQEREYPNRVSATDLSNPDFCALARSFGATADCVHSLEEFETAVAKARKQGGINVIEIPQDPNIIAVGKPLQ